MQFTPREGGDFTDWFKGLNAINEQQDDGAGILHQVAHFPIDQVHFIYTRCPCPSPPMQDPERQGIARKAGRPYTSL